MLLIGRAAAGARFGLRAVAMASAAFFVTLGCTALVTVLASYEGRALRDAARSPVLAEPGEEPPTALWGTTLDNVDFRYTDVVYLVPLAEDAPLPPGVNRWLEPGEVLLSPALQELPEDLSVAERYGQVVGTIGAVGLATPTERLAYVRPPLTGLDRADMQEITGFGVPVGPVGTGLGDALRARNSSEFLMLIALFLGVPAMALLVIAARMGSAARDRRLALVTALGGSPGARRWLLTGEGGPPVLVGVTLAAVPAAVGLLIDLPLPGLDYVVAAVDLRRSFAWLVTAVLLAGATSLLAVLLLHRPPQHTPKLARPLVRSGSPKSSLAAAAVLAAYLTVRLAYSVNVTGLIIPIYVGCVLLTLALFPALLRWSLSQLGTALAWIGRRRGRAGWLVAGRQLSHDAGAHVRLVAGLGIAIVLLCQVQVWASKLGQAAVAAERTRAEVGDSVLIVGLPADPTLVLPALEALDPNIVVVGRTDEPVANRVTLRGDCTALQALALPCAAEPLAVTPPYRDVALQAIADSLGGPELVAQIGSPLPTDRQGGSASTLLLITRDDSPLAIGMVKASLNRFVAPALYADSVGGLTLEGARLIRDQGRWVTALGALGMLALGAGITVAAAAHSVRHSQTLAPLAAVAGHPAVFVVASIWRISLPVMLAGGLGVALAYWLTLPITAPGSGGTLPTSLLVGCLAASILVGAVLAALTARVSIAAAHDWMPGREE